MDHKNRQLWKKEDPDNPFGVDIAIYLDYGDIVNFKAFLIEVGGMVYLNPEEGFNWLDNHHKFNSFNSWYVGNEVPDIRVNHKAGKPCGTGFGERTGYMLPERFMGQ